MGRDTRFIVTSLSGHRSKYLYEKIYCARGQAENYIKSWKRHLDNLASDRTSCSKANANQMRLMIHHCAYWPCTHEEVQYGKTSMRVSSGPLQQKYETHQNISSIGLFLLKNCPDHGLPF